MSATLGELAAIGALVREPRFSDPLRVLVLMPLAEKLGGSEVLLMDLLRSAVGVEWTVVFLADGPMVAETQELGIEAHVVPLPRARHLRAGLAAITRVASLVRARRAQIVLSWMAKAHLIGGPAARLGGVPAVWFRHEIARSEPLTHVTGLIPAAGVFACSEAAAESQRRFQRRGEVHVVHPGIDLTQYERRSVYSETELREQLGIPLRAPIVGMVGRLQRWKGMSTFVEAVALVAQEIPEVQAVIVGGTHALEPDYPRLLAREIAALGLEQRVRLAGYQKNSADWMRCMDVVVHASDAEPFGLVVVEALALGRPTIVSSAGGPAEIATEGEHAMVSPPGDSRALANAMLRLLRDDALSDRLRIAGPKRAQDFSISRHAATLVQHLRDYASPSDACAPS